MVDVEATTEKAGSISAIDKTTVHQICSGQVVLNLATAVKELLENSIDAGATQVEIKLKDYGATCIEVADNGSGVEPKNFEGLTLKHHTSKLRVFQDLVGVETFGFRGEALSSLCALSNVTISTRHIDSALGSVISYDHNGKIISQEKTARSVGTSVTLKNIFLTMPVRLKEFTRNVKKEFAKLCQVLNAYCLVSTGVRISCTNTIGKGKRSTVVSTKGDQNVRDNIVSVFGAKQASSLRSIQNVEMSEEDLTEAGIKTQPPNVQITGFVSSCAHGEGRGAGDRQFFYINSRPCDPTKISKIVNEVYHYYNRHQYPFIFLDIMTSRTTVDVNITPDKRQVFLQNEKYLCLLIKKSLENLYRDQPRSIPLGITKTNNKLERVYEQDEEPVGKEQVTLLNLKRKFSTILPKEPEMKPKQPKLEMFFKKKAPNPEEDDISLEKMKSDKDAHITLIDINKSTDTPEKLDHTTESKDDVQMTTTSYESIPENEGCQTNDLSPDQSDSSHNAHGSDIQDRIDRRKKSLCSKPRTESFACREFGDSIQTVNHHKENKITLASDQDRESTEHSGLRITFDDFPIVKKQRSCSRDLDPGTSVQLPGLTISFDDFTNCKAGDESSCPAAEDKSSCPDAKIEPSCPAAEEEPSCPATEKSVTPTVQVDASTKTERRQVKVKFSMQKMTDSLNAVSLTDQPSGSGKLKFSAKISPQDNSSAESELQRQISKQDFNNMKVYGQFNLGFIIVGLKGDLFIIDQHATDEKYNFETLQQTTVINSQRMVAPQPLELTAANENILIDNLDTFEKNGFKFDINTEAEPTKRVKLASLPISKNWTFGKEDIDEMIFLLSECASGTVIRPSRVRAMFASRACRSSVMIGKALSKGDMRRLVDHMGEIEQPWNCPHGRPTLRHLINLDLAK